MSAPPTYATTERRLLDAACSGLEVKLSGTSARLTIIQPTFDAEGRFQGEARIVVEGRRDFRGAVRFADPLAVTVLGAPHGEEPEFRRMARFAVEALAEADPTAP